VGLIVLLHKQHAAEKIGPHVEPIKAAHVARRIDAAKMHGVHGVSLEAFLSRSSVAMNLSAGALISHETSSVLYSTRRCWLTRGILPTIRASIVEAR
jgi:hypothetical protein